MQLVPNLALAVPSPTDQGRTYAFRLRPNIRYSDGRALRASDVRRAFERLFRVRSPVAPAFAVIAGAGRCGPAACDLARGVAVDDSRRTVVFHLTRPDREFLFKLAYVFIAPVPPGTPWTEVRGLPFPGTGPYRIAEADSRHMRLVRNPFFEEWSRAAQPEGNSDEIVWRFGLTAAAEARAIAAGRADWMFDNVPRSLLGELRRRRPAQLHGNVIPETDFVQIDTRRPPFDDVRVRQAINLAIDRREVVQLYGGGARPTCQILPPDVPGYRHYCPYPYDPSRARKLIGAAGARGAQVRIGAFSDDATVSPAVVRYLASALRRIGLAPTVEWTTHAGISKRHDLVPQGWLADYPAASTFFTPYLECDGAYNRVISATRVSTAGSRLRPRPRASIQSVRGRSEQPPTGERSTARPGCRW